MNAQTFNTELAWVRATISFIKSLAPQTIALSGGSTPQPIYKELEEIPSQFYQVDERYVPIKHPNSNHHMIKETLFQKTNDTSNFHYFDTSLSIKEALEQYKNELQKLPNFPKQSFDLSILGIGPDGHTASLFPDSSGAQNAQPVKSPTPELAVAHTTTTEFAIKDRLTITFKTILASKNLLVLLRNKPGILKELENPSKTPEEFPALKLLDHPRLTIHSFDEKS